MHLRMLLCFIFNILLSFIGLEGISHASHEGDRVGSPFTPYSDSYEPMYWSLVPFSEGGSAGEESQPAQLDASWPNPLYLDSLMLDLDGPDTEMKVCVVQPGTLAHVLGMTASEEAIEVGADLSPQARPQSVEISGRNHLIIWRDSMPFMWLHELGTGLQGKHSTQSWRSSLRQVAQKIKCKPLAATDEEMTLLKDGYGKGKSHLKMQAAKVSLHSLPEILKIYQAIGATGLTSERELMPILEGLEKFLADNNSWQ